jgi:carbonic anhydrase
LPADVGVLAVVPAFSVAFVYASGGGGGESAWSKLVAGNKRFASDNLAQVDIGASRRAELAKGQKPFAIVLACSDSRVGPELIFNQGLGDVFVVRVAGNVVDEIALGSIEYAAEHLHSPLLVVLGRQSCGAVSAALGSHGEPEGNIGGMLKKIMPAVERAKASGKEDAQLLDAAVQENVKGVQAEIMARSHIIKEPVHEGKLKVVAAEYYLDSGEVKVLGM